MNFFISNLFSNPGFFFSWILVVAFSVSFHEYVHARVALHEGDPTAADAGHLTLNPFKQMGIFSLVMLCLIGICWGQVPVRREQMKHSYSDFLVSLSGPLANLFLFFAFLVLTLAVWAINMHSERFLADEQMRFLSSMLINGSIINLVLFGFNILPIPGFDGWALVERYVPLEWQNTELIKGASLVVLMLALVWIDYFFAFAQTAAIFMLSLGEKLL